jgi:hypothetical protein
MKQCSYCGEQNEDEAEVCLICHTPLMPETHAEVDPQLVDPELDLVIVGTYRNAVDATVVKTRLEAAGIEACIPEEYTPQIFWYAVTSPLEPVTVRVAAKDYEAARQLLQEDA